MADVQIIKNTTENGVKCFEAVCGKTTAAVIITQSGVNVICKNAAHRAWGGLGKQFASIADAVNGYKSASMKAIIEGAAA